MQQTDETVVEQPEIALDPIKVQAFRNQMEGEQNLPMGAIAGLVAALAGAIIWAVVTVITKYQIGWMAIGVGVLVGFAVGKFGRGVTGPFGWMGAIFSLLGCALGNLLSVIGFVSIQESVSFFEVLKSVFAQPGLIASVMKATFNPMDVVFYAIAMYEGYNFAFRQITEEEMSKLTLDQENP